MTLAGIDSDKNGLRDDIQRDIYLTYQDSLVRCAVIQSAYAQLAFLQANDDKTMAMNASHERQMASDCLIARLGQDWSKVYKNLKVKILNTKERIRAFYTADAHLGGEIFKLIPISQRINSCKCEEDQI